METGQNALPRHKIKLRKTHVNLPADKKAEVVRALEEPGATFTSVALRFQIDRRTVARLQKKKSDVLKNALIHAKRKRLRFGNVPEMEIALLSWLEIQLSKGVRLSNICIRNKARSLAKEFGVENFTASTGWLTRFKSRNETVFRNAEVDKEVADIPDFKTFQLEVLTNVSGKYHSRNIFCAHETTVFVRASLNQRLVNQRQDLVDIETPVEKVTVLLCASMDGSERRPLLLIGQIHPASLNMPVEDLDLSLVYRSDENGSMTDALWLEWLQAWDCECRLADRHICLFINHHYQKANAELTNIHLVFLPPDSNSIQNPMVIGVISDFEFFYNTAVYNQLTTLQKTYQDFASQSSISLLEAAPLLTEAWQNLSVQTIVDCFSKAGFADMLFGCAKTEADFSIDSENSHQFNDVKEEPLPAWQDSDTMDHSTDVIAYIDATAVKDEKEVNDIEDEYSLTATEALYHLSMVKRFVHSAGLVNSYDSLATIEKTLVEAALSPTSNKS